MGHSASSEATDIATVASGRETRAQISDQPTLATLLGTARHNLRHLLTGGVVRARKVRSFSTRGEKLDGCGIWLVYNAKLHNIRLYTLIYTLGITCTMRSYV